MFLYCNLIFSGGAPSSKISGGQVGTFTFASGWSEATQGFYRTGTLHVILNLVLDVTVSSRGAFSDPYHSGYITMSH